MRRIKHPRCRGRGRSADFGRVSFGRAIPVGAPTKAPTRSRAAVEAQRRAFTLPRIVAARTRTGVIPEESANPAAKSLPRMCIHLYRALHVPL